MYIILNTIKRKLVQITPNILINVLNFSLEYKLIGIIFFNIGVFFKLYINELIA